jgi:hypothetical protein
VSCACQVGRQKTPNKRAITKTYAAENANMSNRAAIV